MWRESSSVKAVNLVKKTYYSNRDNEFFLRDCFFIGAPCRYCCAEPLNYFLAVAVTIAGDAAFTAPGNVAVLWHGFQACIVKISVCPRIFCGEFFIF